jgi:hypothetical protein
VHQLQNLSRVCSAAAVRRIAAGCVVAGQATQEVCGIMGFQLAAVELRDVTAIALIKLALKCRCVAPVEKEPGLSVSTTRQQKNNTTDPVGQQGTH